jgi:glycosyltransferase involved in cell wall biosynthesis
MSWTYWTSYMFGDHRVSCIMPTSNRREFVPRALRYFQQQDYPNCELLVVDDGTDSVADLLPPDPRIRYIRLEERHALGAKRNLACMAASGDIIVHWDDDDWYASWRLSYQVACLLKTQADICGLANLFYYDPAVGRAWEYVYPESSRPWFLGGSFCYTRAFWETNPFLPAQLGTETQFLRSNRPKKIRKLQDHTFYVGIIHTENISPKRPKLPLWRPCPLAAIAGYMGEDWLLYHETKIGRDAILPEVEN